MAQDFYGKIILSGGNTLFAGIGERLTKELGQMAPKSVKIKVDTPPERSLSVWIGGSIVGSLGAFRRLWISKEEYEESGPSVVNMLF